MTTWRKRTRPVDRGRIGGTVPASGPGLQSAPVELRQLRYYAVICEEGSLTRAGRRLHVAQQSLSQTVAGLEAELGVTLLDRGAFGVRTTAAGRVLHERATALLRDADAAARATQHAAGLGSGHVRMRYGLDAEHLVNPLLAAVRERLPHVSITGWTGTDADNLQALRAGGADLVVAWAVDGHAGDLHTVTIAHERCCAAVPQDHPLADRSAIPVDALAGLALVMFPRDAAPWVWDHITGHLAADGRLPPRITQTPVSGQGGTVDEAARSGAVTTVSHSLIASLARPGMRFVPFVPDLTVPLHLVWRAGLSPAGAQVVDVAAALRPA